MYNVEDIKSPSVTITTIKTVKLKGGRKNPLQGRIKKQSTYTLQLSSPGEYQRRATALDQNFTPKPRTWGVRDDNIHHIIHHKNSRYLEGFLTNHISTEYLYENGSEWELISKDQIEGLPESAPNPTGIVCVNEETIYNLIEV